MRIKMLKAKTFTVDGVKTVDAEPGDELAVGDGIGAELVAAGHAKSLDPTTESKDAGAADENKQDAPAEAAEKPAPKPRARSRRKS